MKRILSFFLVVVLLCAAIPVFSSGGTEEDLISLLSELDIMQGDPDGNLRLDDTVSRAEFTKVAVACSVFHHAVPANLSVSPFRDVLHTHWAAPYVQLAVSNALCKGYPDATFRPDNAVLYEEAVTMMLKVLGYTDDDFGVSWPYGQIGMANQLSMTDHIQSGVGRPMTRREVARLAYNTLGTKQKGTNTRLLGTFDCEMIENAIIIATTNEDGSVGANKVFTSVGLLEKKCVVPSDYVGRQGDLVLKNGNELIAFTPNEQTLNRYAVTNVMGADLVLDGKVFNLNRNLKTYYKSQTTTYEGAVREAEVGDTFVTVSGPTGVVDYAVLIASAGGGLPTDSNQLEQYVMYATLQDAIVGYQNGTFHQIEIKDSTPCYKDQVRSTYQMVKAELSMGDLLYVKRDTAGNVEYVSYEKGNIEGPHTVNSPDWASRLGILPDTAVMRGGKKVTMGDVQTGDIVYYSKDLNMVLAYYNKITGVYEKAIPNKDTPTSVVISGTTYQVEGIAAFDKLSSSGTFRYGDHVTLLLGKTNQIADVLSPNAAYDKVAGYLVSAGTKEVQADTSERYTAYYALVAMTDGSVQQYTTDRDYTKSVGKVVTLSFRDGLANLSVEQRSAGVTGVFRDAGRTIGTARFSNDIEILDVAMPASSFQKTGAYAVVYPQRLDGMTLDTNSVLYAKTNRNGEISKLILNDVTGDAYTYGMVTDVPNRTSMGTMVATATYEYNIGKGPQKMTTNGILYSVMSGQPARFVFSPIGVPESIQPLSKVEGAVSDVSASRMQVGRTTYPVSGKVLVFVRDRDFHYTTIPLSDVIANSSGYSLEAYIDRAVSAGGQVRVIVATKR